MLLLFKMLLNHLVIKRLYHSGASMEPRYLNCLHKSVLERYPARVPCGVAGAQESHSAHAELHGVAFPNAVRREVPPGGLPAHERAVHPTGRGDQRHEEPAGGFGAR